MPSTRRSALRVLGVGLVGSVAGCTAGERGSDARKRTHSRTDESTETDSLTATEAPPSTPGPGVEIGETQAVDDASVTVRRVGVQKSFLSLQTDSMYAGFERGTQYVFAEISGSERAPSSPDFALATSEGSFGGTTNDIARNVHGWETSYSSFYDADGWIAFPVPSPLDTVFARIVVGDAAWELGDEHLRALSRPAASYEVTGFDYPSAVGFDESFSVDVTVRNTADVRGTFRGALNVANGKYAYYPYPFALELEPGRTASWNKEYGAGELDGSAREMDLHLRTVAGTRHGSVSLGGTPTPDNG